ncbi:hypothetical protein [Bradyrhizobium sp. SZCCHNR3118]|uniref:hypothetical protein n=1 Tax=Bradyrhizobium sp. SZCCHNR3118 TaxID=3057468 RepID=UPI00291670E4|nr:hypothetical protein [Bradyrhizobium sp. SZCCHNR3118]
MIMLKHFNWPKASEFKYVNIRVDTRNGNFLVLSEKDEKGERRRVDPDEIAQHVDMKAVDEHLERVKTIAARASQPVTVALQKAAQIVLNAMLDKPDSDWACTKQAVKAARAILALPYAQEKAVVSVEPMQLSDGRTDYYVAIRVGDKFVTPHVFREEYKAAYHIALYDWLLNGTGEEPCVVDFGPDDYPARVHQPAGSPDHISSIIYNRVTSEADKNFVERRWLRGVPEAATEIASVADRERRHGIHLMLTARKMGWKDDGEGALEYLMRMTRQTAIEDSAKAAGNLEYNEEVGKVGQRYLHEVTLDGEGERLLSPIRLPGMFRWQELFERMLRAAVVQA